MKKYMVLIYRLLKKYMILINPIPIGLDNPTEVVKVNSLYRYDKDEIPPTKIASQCLDEFDNFMVKQEDFNAYFGRELKCSADMLEHLGDYMANVKGELKLISKTCFYGYHSSRASA